MRLGAGKQAGCLVAASTDMRADACTTAMWLGPPSSTLLSTANQAYDDIAGCTRQKGGRTEEQAGRWASRTVSAICWRSQTGRAVRLDLAAEQH